METKIFLKLNLLPVEFELHLLDFICMDLSISVAKGYNPVRRGLEGIVTGSWPLASNDGFSADFVV